MAGLYGIAARLTHLCGRIPVYREDTGQPEWCVSSPGGIPAMTGLVSGAAQALDGVSDAEGAVEDRSDAEPHRQRVAADRLQSG